jgi:hypothetical protein
MGFASHLGPWLLGTNKYTTGTATGTVQNMGASIVAQTKIVAYADTTAQTTAFVLPAGSLITACQFIITTAYTTTAPTFTIFVNGTQASSAVTLGALVGANSITLGGNSAAGAALIANVGSTDATIAFTQSNGAGGTGAGILVMAYIVRGSDGAMYPTSQQN